MNTIIDRIEFKLSLLLERMDYIDYLLLIYSNPKLKRYDKIMGSIDLGLVSQNLKYTFSQDDLQEIECIIDKQLTNCIQ